MEDFVDFYLAKKLKEKGFPQHWSDQHYILENEYEDDFFEVGTKYPVEVIYDYIPTIAAPTISQVLKWFRDENIYCLPWFEQGVDMWFYAICKPTSGCDFPEFMSESDYNTYEQAAIAGIEYVLDNLI
jgi:hypothetical protein